MTQHTIKHVVSCFGIGLHSGKPTSISLYPADPDTGVTFIRTDVKNSDNKIRARYSNVSRTNFGTTIRNSAGIEIATVEHFMAALWSCKIDNVIVEVDGLEIPSMDGSAEPFIFMIECAGIKAQEAHRKYLEILKEIVVEDGESRIKISPNEHLQVDVEIKFDSKLISTQQYSFSEKTKSFKHDVSRARTFGFKQEEEALKKCRIGSRRIA